MGAISNLTNKGKEAAKEVAPAATSPRSALPGQPDVSRPGASATSPSRNDIKKGVESAKESAREKVDQASSKASELSDRASNKASELSDRASNKASELSDRASNKASELSEKAGDKAAQLRKTAETKAAELRKAAEEKTAALRNKTEKAADKAGREIQNTAADAKETLSNATAEARESLGNAGRAIKDQAKDVVDGAKRAGAQFSEGVQSLVDEAENALGKTAKDVRQTARQSTDDVPASTQAQLVDTQPPRKLDPTHGSDPIADLKEGGKRPYTGPALPLGFEPPPGYYIPKAIAQAVQSPNAATEQPAAPAEKPKPVLPLLAPKVKEFDSSAEEPIISQLASTIDTLASSLSATSSVAGDASTSSPPSPPAVLSQAQTDLSALSNRLKALKEEEKTKLEKSLQAKAAEFDKTLKQRESEWTNKEGQLLEGWNQEREKLVEGWRKVLDRELEGQRVGIEQRLREEVIAQGIELQRRWLRSIKAQVESERGGRLAKLDNLTTSFKQLERITLDNSNHLDANLSLHTLWSALRAVQAKADRGNVSFEDELRVLKSAASSQVFSKDERTRDVIAAMIDSIEASGSASQGIKSFPSLAGWFSTTLLPKIQSVSLVPAEHEAGILSHLASAGLSRVLFRRKAGWVEGDDVGAVLARAEYLLAEKDLDGAAREMNQLQGWAGKLAGDWLREARKRLEVEQALNVSFFRIAFYLGRYLTRQLSQVISTEATLSSLLLV